MLNNRNKIKQQTRCASIECLTPREIEILRLIVNGKSNKAIAAELYISIKTVEYHLKNLYGKIDVQSRTEAIVWAIKHGVMPSN